MTRELSRLGKQIEEVVAALHKTGTLFALIGGLALAPHKVVRATQDVDLLIDADLAEAVDAALTALGYQCIHRSADAANYLRGDERVDFLYAHRSVARQLLAAAPELQTPFGSLRVVSAEGLIAFKLQGWVNNRDPFEALDDLMQVVEALCPRWPERESFGDTAASVFKL